MAGRLALSITIALLAGTCLTVGGCERRDAASNGGGGAADDHLMLAAYSAVDELYRQSVIPAFEHHWSRATGRRVIVDGRFAPSGAQARAVIGGLPADVVVLSLAGDVARIEADGLITHDWRDDPSGGIITQSIVAIGVRKGNPAAIADWDDLTRAPVTIIHADPRSSGAGMWVVAAVYGAALTRSQAMGGDADSTAARDLLLAVESRVIMMDTSSRRALDTFERGIGDAVIDYESAIREATRRNPKIELVVPEATILIENPAAIVDRNVDLHGNREVADAFVEFLRSDAAQQLFATHGLRPLAPAIRRAYDAAESTRPRLFDIESLGGWDEARSRLFAPGGVWPAVRQEIAAGLEQGS